MKSSPKRFICLRVDAPTSPHQSTSFHRCLMGFRSEFCSSHPITWNCFFENQSFNKIWLCFWSLSCWKTITDTSNSWFSMVSSNSSFWYFKINKLVHGSFNKSQIVNSFPWHAPPHYDAPSGMLHCCLNMPIAKRLSFLFPTPLGAIRTKMVEFWLVIPNHMLPLFFSIWLRNLRSSKPFLPMQLCK